MIKEIKDNAGLYILMACFAGLFSCLFIPAVISWGADGDPLLAGVNRGKVIGEIYPITLTSDEPLTGASTFGGWITGGSGVSPTATIGHASGGENMVFRNLADTSLSGGTIFIVFSAGVSNTILTESGVTIDSGVTKIEVSGTTLDQVVTLIGAGVSTWEVHSKQTLTTQAQ
ncbi:MAG: hypothetical protein ABIJ57_03325 [Pseudomonadota bacterium]